MSKHRSLVVFTLLTQPVVGSVWCVGFALLLRDTPPGYGWHAFVALLLVLAGPGFSTGHLGRPGVCFYAIRNLRHSWVSREVAATVTLAAAVAAMALTSLRPGGLNGWVVFAASAIGGICPLRHGTGLPTKDCTSLEPPGHLPRFPRLGVIARWTSVFGGVERSGNNHCGRLPRSRTVPFAVCGTSRCSDRSCCEN